MEQQLWIWIMVGITFTLYIGIAIWSRASSTKEFYVAGEGVSPIANGMATAADWMSAASFFPAIVMGIFSKRMNKEVVISGMVVGISLMLFYMIKFKLGFFGGGTSEDWWFGVSPEDFGTLAMCANILVAILISYRATDPPKAVQLMIDEIRKP